MKFFILAATLALAAPASAKTITFDELTNPGTFSKNVGPVLETDGYRFSGAADAEFNLIVWGADSVFNADPGGATLVTNYWRMATTVTAIDGGAFDLVSLDVSNDFNYGQVFDLVFTFTDAFGTSEVTVYTDGVDGLETLVFNKTSLLSFSYMSTTKNMQIDNVVVNASTPVMPGVPEPATWAMLIAGFGLVGAAMRRRQAVTA